MPYIKSTCRAGKTKIINMYYSERYKPEKGSREKKKNETKAAQREVNKRQAEQKLTRIMNANFNGRCWYLTLKYKKENRPTNRKGLRKHIYDFLRALRKLYKKNSMILKYIWVAEIGSKGAMHTHIVISEPDSLNDVLDLWDHGFVTQVRMDKNGQYSRLANYFIKYSDITMKTTGELQGRRYNPSQNLIHPIPTKRTITSRKKFDENIKVPKGWYLDEGGVESGIHGVTGYPFMQYILIKLE